MIEVEDRDLLPLHLSHGKNVVKANKIAYIERHTSEFVKDTHLLGTILVPTLLENGISMLSPKEKVFRLQSLYRCIVDTGIIINDYLDSFDYTVENHPQFVTRQGLHVLSPVRYNDNGVVKLGIAIVNLSSIDIEIKKYMPFAVLVTREKSFANVKFTFNE